MSDDPKPDEAPKPDEPATDAPAKDTGDGPDPEKDLPGPTGDSHWSPPLPSDHDKLTGLGLVLDAPNEMPQAADLVYEDLGPDHKYDENEHFDPDNDGDDDFLAADSADGSEPAADKPPKEA